MGSRTRGPWGPSISQPIGSGPRQCGLGAGRVCSWWSLGTCPTSRERATGGPGSQFQFQFQQGWAEMGCIVLPVERLTRRRHSLALFLDSSHFRTLSTPGPFKDIWDTRRSLIPSHLISDLEGLPGSGKRPERNGHPEKKEGSRFNDFLGKPRWPPRGVAAAASPGGLGWAAWVAEKRQRLLGTLAWERQKRRTARDTCLTGDDLDNGSWADVWALKSLRVVTLGCMPAFFWSGTGNG